MYNSKLLSSISLAAFMVSMPAFAADVLNEEQFEERFSGAAVSALNAKIEVGKFHVGFDDDNNFGPLGLENSTGYFVQGAVSAPLVGQFGIQIDAGMMDGDADVNIGGDVDINARAIGAHLFWRDPSKGLLGIYAAYSDYEIGNLDVDNTRVGVEGEAYMDRLTLKGFVGKDFTDYETFGNEDYVAASAGVDYYLTDNFMVGVGVDHSFETTAFTAGFEWMGDTGGVSPALFTDVAFNDGDTTVMAGLKVYLGQEGKSLIRRHREDDPGINLFDNISALGSCVAGLGGLKKGSTMKPAVQANAYAPVKFKYSVNGCNSKVSFGEMDSNPDDVD